MTRMTARLVGDLLALAEHTAPVTARAAQVRDVLTDHALRAGDVTDDAVAALAESLDQIAATAWGQMAALLGLPTAPVETPALAAGDPGEGLTRVWWVREDGRSEQRWVADVPTSVLRDVADGQSSVYDLDSRVCATGVLLTPTVVDIDEDEMSCGRVEQDWTTGEGSLEYPECWPEATNPRALTN